MPQLQPPPPPPKVRYETRQSNSDRSRAAAIARQAVRSRRRFDLRGKVVVITGGSRGLGLGLAREFGRNGTRVAICARDEDELARAKADLLDRGVDALTVAWDLTDPVRIAAMLAAVKAKLGGIDVLVNNAGTISVGPVENMTIDDFREAMDVNYWAAVHATLAVLPEMKARGGGRVVNVASVGGKMPVPHLVPYSASKFALVGFSGGVRAEMMKDNVLVTCVNPGLMRTGSPRHATFKGNHKAEYAWFSIADATPGLSMAVETAARRIVAATVHGDAEVTLGLPAKAGALLYALFPNFDLDLAGLVAPLLPSPGGVGARGVEGKDSESAVTRSP